MLQKLPIKKGLLEEYRNGQNVSESPNSTRLKKKKYEPLGSEAGLKSELDLQSESNGIPASYEQKENRSSSFW